MQDEKNLGDPAASTYQPVGPCERPLTHVDPDTGEVVMIRCGSRLARRCGSCSAIAKKDYQVLIRGGFTDVDAKKYRYFFLTLTAPSFGAVHKVPKAGRPPSRCRCGIVHDPVDDAAMRGVPLDLSRYDYAGAVAWNYNVGKLWDATRSMLSKTFPGASFAKVFEFQARGTLHVHVLIRIPVRNRVVYGAHSGIKAVLHVARSVRTRRGMAWGAQGDCRMIRHLSKRDRTVSYLSKMLTYVTKDAAGGVSGTRPAAARDHFDRLDDAALHLECDRCADAERWDKCRSLAHRRWGARSSVLSRSRAAKTHEAWSPVRRMDLKARRVAFAQHAERVKVAMDVFARMYAGQSSGPGWGEPSRT